jgi:hypothetical protein
MSEIEEQLTKALGHVRQAEIIMAKLGHEKYSLSGMRSAAMWDLLEQEVSKLLRELADMTKQRDELQEWKDSAMQVELSWDAQSVGKLIGFAIGSAIHSQIEPAIREIIKQRDALTEALPLAMARAYERGYQHGHEDTVESKFVIVHANYALDYFADDVRQMLLDGSQPEAQKALAATKGEGHDTLQG